MNKRIIKNFLSFIFFLFLTLFIFRAFLKISISKNIIGNLWDPPLNLYILKHNIDRILTFNFKNFFDASIFYPYKLTLTFSENLISSSIFLLPVYIFSKNIVFAYNIFIILNFIFSGFFMYLFSYHLTKNFFSSIIAGTIFSFAPFKFYHTMHIQILTTMWIPLIFLFLHKFFESKKYRFIVFSSTFFIIESLGCGYYMVIISPFILIMFIFYILKEKGAIRNYLTGFLIFIFLSGIFLIPVYYQYLKTDWLYGFKRPIVECINFSPDIRAFLTSYPFTLTGKFFSKFTKYYNAHENALYIGIIPMLSIIFISIFILKKSIIIRFKKENSFYFLHFERRKISPPNFSLLYLIMLFISFMLLFGPNFFRITYLYNPFYLFFYYFFPGAKGLRVPPRFFIMFLFSSSVLISYFYSLYFRKRTLIILETLILLEFIPYYIPISKMPYKGEVPSVYKWLKEKNGKFAIMELPIQEAWFQNVLQSNYHKSVHMRSLIHYGEDKGFFYTYFSAYHKKKILNGYSGYYSPLFNYAKSVGFRRHIEIAKAINIKYLIIHKDVYRDNPHIFPENMLKEIISIIGNEYSQELRKVYEDNISVVYEIVSRNRQFNPDKGYLKEYRFRVHLTYKKMKRGKLVFLVFVYEGDKPCILLYKNDILLEYYSKGKLVYTQKIIITPGPHPFLLKGERFGKEIKLPKVKSGKYLIKLKQDRKTIGQFKTYL